VYPGRTPVAWDITSGPDGALWFTEPRDAIGRITTDGQVTERAVAQPPGGPVRDAWEIAVDRDGGIWFIETDPRNGWIDRMTPTGAVDHFALPTGHFAAAIAVGPDRNLWLVEQSGRIGRVTPSGDVLEIDLPGRAPRGLTVGPDRALWFTDYVGASFIGRFDIDGAGGVDAGATIAEYPLSPVVANTIVAAPDGGFWISETIFVFEPLDAGGVHGVGGKLAHRAADGAVNELATDTGSEGPADLTIGPDGNIWFTDFEQSRIGRVTPDGTITLFPLPHAPSYPRRITTGPDGNLWFTEDQTIGRLIPP
jgi:virginiamycin B lyase